MTKIKMAPSRCTRYAGVVFYLVVHYNSRVYLLKLLSAKYRKERFHVCLLGFDDTMHDA